MTDERRLRNLEARVEELAERYFPVSEKRLNQLWESVRASLDEFTQRLIAQELARRGHNDTLAKLLAGQQKIDTVLATQAVQIRNLQEQLNTTTIRLAELEAERLGETVEPIG